jgi:hypothetical protein
LTTEIKVKGNRLHRMDALEFIQEKLAAYDMSQVSEIKYEWKPYTARKFWPTVYGNAKHPNPFAKTHKARNTYRVSLMLRGVDDDLPYTKHATRIRRRYAINCTTTYHNLAELMVFGAGHEMYHVGCWTKQINGDVNDDKAADRMGDSWVQEYRRQNA